ncbi:MAG: autotransporter-associated beta strand repeat-containing protein [Pirellulales bacterium]
MTKTGFGTLGLSIPSQLNYTGVTTITQGTLDFNGFAQTVTGLTMGGGAAGTSSTLDLDGATLTLGGNVIYLATNNPLAATITSGTAAVIDFGGVARTFDIGDSTAADPDMIIDTNVTLQNDGGLGLIKSGAGTLRINGTNNLTGPIQVQGGAVTGNVGTNNLVLNNGVFEGNGTFTRSLGTGNNQVQWFAGASGGFSAAGGPLTVTLSGAPDPLVWDGTPFFVSGAGGLIFGSTTATDVVTFTHNINLNAGARTVTVNDNALSTNDKAVLTGILSNSSAAVALTKGGAGTLELTAANTFTGGVTVSAGTLQFSTVSNNGGAASNLGQGTDGLAIGAGRLQFIGSTNQQTNRDITISGAGVIDASGSGTITFSGDIAFGSNNATFDGSGSGVLAGLITQSGTSADFIKSGAGTWRIDVAQPNIADNFIINSGTVILNIADVYTLDDMFVRSGTLKFNVNNAVTGLVDDLNVSTESSGGGFLDIAGTTGSSPNDLIVGATGLAGNVIDSVGGGSIGAVATIAIRNGTISASLTGAAAMTKTTSETVTLTGVNTGFTGTTTLTSGTLILDFTTNNGKKLSNTGAGALTGDGGNLVINGNASAPTLETLGGLTLTGRTLITINPGGAQTATLNLSGVTRAVSGGTLNIVLTSANAVAQTSTPNTAGILGGYAIINSANFATVSGGALAELAATIANTTGIWPLSGNVTDSTGYTGTVGVYGINSIRFNAAGAVSNVAIASGFRLNVGSGGILSTTTISSGTASITGGTLMSAINDLIFHQYNLPAPLTVGSSIIRTTAVTKAGPGMLVLSGNNSYSGTTTINEGTILLSGGNAIGDNSLVDIINIAGATLDLGNGTETIAGLTGGGSLGGTVAIGTGTLTINNNIATQTYIGTITGSGTIIKTGLNSQELEGSNPGFTGTVIIERGLLHLDSTSGALQGATSFTLNGGELLSDQDQTGDVNRIGNTAVITLNNTAGTRGFWLRNEAQDASATEEVGDIILGAGHNVIQADPSNTDSSAIADLQSTSLTRVGKATALVRGLALGLSSGRRGQIVFAATPAGGTGGGGTAGTTTMTIIPYLVGDATGATGLGNSFVFDTGDTNGLRPLSLVVGTGEEYVHNEAGYNALSGATNNVRFVANPAATLTGGSKTINSLVLDSSAAALTITGNAADTLTLTAGALLATTTVAANNSTLGGFAGLAVGSGNEYLMYVTQTSNTLTISSPLVTTAASLTKSGAGILSLTGTGNAYTGGTWINQGFIQIDSLSRLSTGAVNFDGGGIRFAVGYADDLSTRTINVLTGGGFIDSTLIDGVLPSGLDMIGNASSYMTLVTRANNTTGSLTIQGSSSFTGTVVVAHTSVNSGTTNSVILNGATNAAINGNLHIGNVGAVTNNDFDAVVALGADEQIVNTAVITLRGTSGEFAYFKLFGHTETVAGISDPTNSTVNNFGVIENADTESDAIVTADGKLIVNSAADYSYTSLMRDRSTTNTFKLQFEKQGTGTQTLGGTGITYTGATTISGGTLLLLETTAFASDVVNNATLALETASSWTFNRAVSGSGSLKKLGIGVVSLSGVNSYSGQTLIHEGILEFSAASALGNASATNTIKIYNGSTLRSLGANVALAANQSIELLGASASINVQGTVDTTLTVNGGVTGGALTHFNKDGAGTLILAAANTFPGGVSVNAGVLDLRHASALGSTSSAVVANSASLVFNASALGPAANFSLTGAGNVLTLGASGGSARLGFGLSGATNDKLLLSAGQTFLVNGTSVFADIYVNGTPTASSYNLIESINATSYAQFTLGNIFNPGAFVYQLVNGGANNLVLNVTAVSAPATAYWKGDLGGTGTGVWNAVQTGGNSNWDTSASGGVDAQVPPDATSDVFFSATGAANFTTTLGADMAIKSLTFLSGSGSGGQGTTVGGTDTLTIGTGGITLAALSGDITISSKLALAASQTWTITDALNVLLTSGSVSGAFDLTKQGAGILTLNGVNLYTGKTLVNAGTLRINSESSLGGVPMAAAADHLTLAAGTTFNTTANLTIDDVGRGVTLSGSGTVTIDVNAATTAAINNVVSGTANLTVGGTGTGTLALNASNLYTGKTLIATGTLQINSEASLGVVGVAAADYLAIAAGATLNTTADLTIDDAGRGITLSGTGMPGSTSTPARRPRSPTSSPVPRRRRCSKPEPARSRSPTQTRTPAARSSPAAR